jgi:hypothetical protein
MSSSDDSDLVVVPLDPQSISDGDPDSWPKEERFRRVDDKLYRQKIATMWLQRQGRYDKGEIVKSLETEITILSFLLLL